jgi:hypothetical protein
MLETTAHSVNSLLRRARAAFESRLPAAGRDQAPLPDSKRERDTFGRFADVIQTGDINGVVALLTEDAWLTMPPEPYEYQGPARIGAFRRDRTITRGAPLLVPTRANTQPAFGAYFPTPQIEITRLYGILVLTLEGSQISAITWFGGTSASPHFGLPRVLRPQTHSPGKTPSTRRGTRATRRNQSHLMTRRLLPSSLGRDRKASRAASSARSMSPRKPTEDARIRRHPCRKTRSISDLSPPVSPRAVGPRPPRRAARPESAVQTRAPHPGRTRRARSSPRAPPCCRRTARR